MAPGICFKSHHETELSGEEQMIEQCGMGASVHDAFYSCVCLQILKEKLKFKRKILRVLWSEKSRQCLSWSCLGNSQGT